MVKNWNKVKEFEYLGSIISADGSMELEISSRIGKAVGSLRGLNKIWKNKTISTKTKMKLYRANALSILLYGFETWQLKEADEDRLNAFDYKCSRKILKTDWRDHNKLLHFYFICLENVST
jgi:hypothetical protein